MSAFGPRRTFHMSHLLSLSGVRRACLVALHESAFDPKRTSDVADSLPLLLAMLKLPYPPPSDRGGFPLLLIMAGKHPQSPREGKTTNQTKTPRAAPRGEKSPTLFLHKKTPPPPPPPPLRLPPPARVNSPS